MIIVIELQEMYQIFIYKAYGICYSPILFHFPIFLRL
jgi:hypothetical protein